MRERTAREGGSKRGEAVAVLMARFRRSMLRGRFARGAGVFVLDVVVVVGIASAGEVSDVMMLPFIDLSVDEWMSRPGGRRRRRGDRDGCIEK